MNDLVPPLNPDDQSQVSPPVHILVRQRIRALGLFRLGIFAVALGIGLTVGLTAVTYGVRWYLHRPIPPKTWPEMELQSVGIKMRLKTDWNQTLRYQFSVWPISPDLARAFDAAADSHRGSVRFVVYFADTNGFNLCQFEIHPTPDLGNDGLIGAVSADDKADSCSREQYHNAVKWTVAWVFPHLASAPSIQPVPSSQAAPTPNPAPRRKQLVAIARANTEVPPEPEQKLDLLDFQTGFDLSTGHLETRTSGTFLVYREGERMTALTWQTWAEVSRNGQPPLHIVCQTRSDCLIENRKTNQAVHAKWVIEDHK